MNKKVVLIGLSVSALMVTTLATALSGKANIEAFADNDNPGVYIAEISKDNRLISGSGGYYAFRLHGGEEYGRFYASDFYSSGDRYIDFTNENYAFEWKKTLANDYYFEIRLIESNNEYVIGGKKRTLRGFPGAYKITTVYSESEPDLSFDVCPDFGWTTISKTKEGDLITAVATKNDSADNYSSAMTWCLRDMGTVSIKSITVEYTC